MPNFFPTKKNGILRGPVLICVSMMKRALFSGGISLLVLCSAVAQGRQRLVALSL